MQNKPNFFIYKSKHLKGRSVPCVNVSRFFNQKVFCCFPVSGHFPYSKDFAVFPVSRHSKAISGWTDGLDPTIIILSYYYHACLLLRDNIRICCKFLIFWVLDLLVLDLCYVLMLRRLPEFLQRQCYEVTLLRRCETGVMSTQLYCTVDVQQVHSSIYSVEVSDCFCSGSTVCTLECTSPVTGDLQSKVHCSVVRCPSPVLSPVTASG